MGRGWVREPYGAQPYRVGWVGRKTKVKNGVAGERTLEVKPLRVGGVGRKT